MRSIIEARSTRAAITTLCGIAAAAWCVRATSAADSELSARRELLADAWLRTSYAEDTAGAESASAGRDDKGFFIKSGESRLTLGGRIQFRYNINSREDGSLPEDFTSGFGFRRVRIIAAGSLTKQLGYYLQGNLGRGDTFRLLDAYSSWKFDDQWTLRAGQFKMPLLKEELVSHTGQLATERSTANAVFTQDYSQGVELAWVGEDFRAAGAISDGLRAVNTDFDAAPEADIAFTARGEYKWAGDWKALDMFSSFRASPLAGSVGYALHYQSGGETGGTVDQDIFEYTLDALAKGDGWNAYGAFIGKNADAAGNSFNDFGLLVQGGYFLSEQWEAFARYSHVIPDSDRANGDDFREITVGASYFVIPNSRAAKFTADATYCLDDQAGASAIVGTSNHANGLLPSGEDGQVYIRLQLTTVF